LRVKNEERCGRLLGMRGKKKKHGNEQTADKD
jgi:hypothetical protein